MRAITLVLLCTGLLAAVAPARGQVGGARDPGGFADTLDVAAAQPYALRPFVLPGTVRIVLDGVPLDSTGFQLDYRRGHLWVFAPIPSAASVLVAHYRTVPFAFKDVYRRRRITEAVADTTGAAVSVVEEAARPDGGFDPFGDLRLQRSGSITRGILAGNNRDVTVESGLRMQLSGEVVEGVEVQAVLTDENTPILPEGTTQRIDEFDKVFIQLTTRRGQAQLGDFDLAFTGTEFARFTRKLQGISLAGTLPDFETRAFGGGTVAVAGATARGIFRSQDLVPIDGVQGPYRLEGQNGERFIIVIPGSEVVYLDGQRLTRGETNDYVIDYATGEVTFTARRLITSDRRLAVEFQYTTNQFTRTIVGSQVQTGFWQRRDGTARARFGATFLREADSQQFDEEFGFTQEDSLLVAQSGDAAAFRTGAEPVLYDPEAPYVQYIRAPRANPAGNIDTVFVALAAAPMAGETVFRVRFTRVGAGQGSYARVGRGVNGIQYEYRGAGLGEYAPVRLLPKPKQQRLVDFHGGITPLKGLDVFGEWARSLNDQNRLSALDAADDTDDAFLAGFRLAPTPLAVGETALGTLSAEVRRRFTGAHFTTFDRTRPVEFGRRWNLSRSVSATGGVVDSGDETVDEAEVTYALTPRTRLTGELGRLDLGGTFAGTRRAVHLEAGETGLPRLDYRVEYVTSQDSLRGEDGTWFRQLGVLSQPFLGGRLVPRMEIETERREQEVFGTDSLTSASVSFVELRPGIAWTTEKLNIGAEVERRTEALWADGTLRDAATAWTVQTRLTYRPSPQFSSDADVGYRVKAYNTFFRINQKREDTEGVVLRWNGTARPLRRAVDVSWLYEAQTERTPTLQEIYVRTGAELGQFVWEDANGDGAIQIDEFLPERTPDEGEYVRTFVPSDSLSAVISVQARLRVALDPSKLWPKAAHGWQRVLSQLSTRTTLEVQEKSRDPELREIYLLNLSRFRNAENTLNGRLRVAQDLFLFRRATHYGLDLSYNQVRGLTELAAGEEARLLTAWRAEGRYRPATQWGLKLIAARERNRVASEAFASRRFDIESLDLEPEVSFQPSRAFRVAVGAAFARKRDAVAARQARVLRVPIESRYTQARRLQLTTRFEVAHVTLTDPEGQAVGLAGFELTDGRGAGTSFLWGIQAQYALNRYLRASLAYDGRAPADAPTLHTVRMQLSAVF